MCGNLRADPLEQHGPKNQMRRDFGKARRFVVVTQPELMMQPQDNRKGAGYEPQVVKVRVEESCSRMWLNDTAVHDVGRATEEEEGIQEVGKTLHFTEDLI